MFLTVMKLLRNHHCYGVDSELYRHLMDITAPALDTWGSEDIGFQLASYIDKRLGRLKDKIRQSGLTMPF